jgi:hypothetical protein
MSNSLVRVTRRDDWDPALLASSRGNLGSGVQRPQFSHPPAWGVPWRRLVGDLSRAPPRRHCCRREGVRFGPHHYTGPGTGAGGCVGHPAGRQRRPVLPRSGFLSHPGHGQLRKQRTRRQVPPRGGEGRASSHPGEYHTRITDASWYIVKMTGGSAPTGEGRGAGACAPVPRPPWPVVAVFAPVREAPPPSY